MAVGYDDWTNVTGKYSMSQNKTTEYRRFNADGLEDVHNLEIVRRTSEGTGSDDELDQTVYNLEIPSRHNLGDRIGRRTR